MVKWEDLKNNKQKVTIYGRYKPCGVECPECGAELQIDTMIVLTSYPEQHSYHCPVCKWHGTA